MSALGLHVAFVLFQQEQKKVDPFPENTFDLFFNINNPIFFSVFVAAFVILLAYYVINKQMIPRIREHELEKINIQNKYTKSMAMLAEAAPDPVLRVNSEGKIIFSNNAAGKLGIDLASAQVASVVPALEFFDFEKCIHNASELNFEQTVNENTFNIIIKGIPDLEAVQIYFYDITALKQYEEDLKVSKEKLTELSGHLQSILEVERSRISKELHDGLGQTLSFLRLKLESLNNNTLSDKEKLEIQQVLSDAISNAVTELKSISYDLKPRLLEVHGLVPALQMLVDQVSEREGVKGIFEAFDIEKISPKLEITIYRICQELTNNIIKHSNAKNFSLQISQDPDVIKIIVDDDGVGFDIDKLKFDKTKARGMGLVSITERVEAFKGNINIDSSPGNGTVVLIDFPINGSFGS